MRFVASALGTMSPQIPWTVVPGKPSWSTQRSSDDRLTSTTARFAPCLANRPAVARPSPLAPPTTTMAFPVTSIASAQIGFLDLWIGEELGAGTLKADRSGFDDIAVVGDLQGKKGVLLD